MSFEHLCGAAGMLAENKLYYKRTGKGIYDNGRQLYKSILS